MLTTYYPGGVIQGALAQNRSEQWDTTAATYTHWNPDGTVASTRAMTASETVYVNDAIVPATFSTNQQAIIAKAWTAVQANAAFLAIPNPTAAQAIAQVGILTKECTALIRLILGSFETPSDT